MDRAFEFLRGPTFDAHGSDLLMVEMTSSIVPHLEISIFKISAGGRTNSLGGSDVSMISIQNVVVFVARRGPSMNRSCFLMMRSGWYGFCVKRVMSSTR